MSPLSKALPSRAPPSARKGVSAMDSATTRNRMLTSSGAMILCVIASPVHGKGDTRCAALAVKLPVGGSCLYGHSEEQSRNA